MVINQEDSEGEPVNAPLRIPEKPRPASIDIVYYDEPTVVPKAVKFEEYDMESGTDLLSDYKRKDRAWALANYLGNKRPQTAGSDAVVEDAGDEESQMDSDEDLLPVDELAGQRSILEVSKEPAKSRKTGKEDVLPTW